MPIAARSFADRVQSNLWLARQCADRQTFLAMKGRPISGGDDGLASLRFRFLDRPIVYRPNTTDIRVAWEVFHGDEYRTTCAAWPFRTIVDCGANVGMFMAFATAVTGEAGLKEWRYVGVEPDAASFEILRRQASAMGLNDRAILINAAVAANAGTVRFDDSRPSWGRCVSDSGSRLVTALTVSDVLDQAGLEQCDLLKLDVEGSEREILATLPDWSARVNAIVCEFHRTTGYGYKKFAQIVQAAGYEPFPPGQLFKQHASAVKVDHLQRFGISS